MFHTNPAAEQHMPPLLMDSGEKCWRWIELTIQVPYYLVSFSLVTEEAEITMQYMFIHVRDVIGLLNNSGDKIRNLKIGLLSPGYMNGSNSYQLGQIKQIWRSKDGDEQFLMDNGKTLRFSLSENEADIFEGELVLAL